MKQSFCFPLILLQYYLQTLRVRNSGNYFFTHINFAQLIKGSDRHGYEDRQISVCYFTLLRNTYLSAAKTNRLSVHRSGYTRWIGDRNNQKALLAISCNVFRIM